MKNPIRSLTPASHHGFTLTELAIVLIIVSLLVGGLMMSLVAQQDAIASSETRRRLDDARDALLGYAAANGRLPCPAAPGTTGIESPAGGGACSNAWDGFLPAITLGIAPTDANGYALDAWGNPIRYAITSWKSAISCINGTNFCFATTNGIKAAWNNGTVISPDLRVCSTSMGMTPGGSADCAAGATLTSEAAAVIFSRGKNGGSPPSSGDEQANGNADRLFVSHTPTPAGANEFDDMVTWLSPNILYSRLIAAGRLP